MLKAGNKHTRVICDACSKLSIGGHVLCICRVFAMTFNFEQHLIIPVVSLLLTVNKYTASRVLSL